MSGSASLVCFFSVFLVLGSLFEKIFGSELLFLGVVVGLVFFDSVLPRFLFYYLVFCSRKCLGKILFMSGLLFWGFVLFLLVARRRRLFVFVFCCFFKRESSGLTGHTPHRTLCSCSFFFCPRRTGFISRFGRASFLSCVLSGCHSGPGRFGVFLDSFGTVGARDYSPPSEAFFSDARRQGCLLSILLCRVLFFPFCVVCGYTFY